MFFIQMFALSHSRGVSVLLSDQKSFGKWHNLFNKEIEKIIEMKKPPKGGYKKNLVTTYSPVPAIGTVPSARTGLTSLFGMGRGVSPSL